MLPRRFRRGKGRLRGFGIGNSLDGDVRLGGGKVKEKDRKSVV